MALPEPPAAHTEFVAAFPDLGEAWGLIQRAGTDGPLDPRTQRLVKLGVAIGAMRQGSVHSGVRKALAMGIEAEALMQVVALAAGTLGLPAVVANHCWVKAEIARQTSD